VLALARHGPDAGGLFFAGSSGRSPGVECAATGRTSPASNASPMVAAVCYLLRICLFAMAALMPGHWRSTTLSFGAYFRVK